MYCPSIDAELRPPGRPCARSRLAIQPSWLDQASVGSGCSDRVNWDANSQLSASARARIAQSAQRPVVAASQPGRGRGRFCSLAPKAGAAASVSLSSSQHRCKARVHPIDKGAAQADASQRNGLAGAGFGPTEVDQGFGQSVSKIN